jgi:hypothetical protein
MRESFEGIAAELHERAPTEPPVDAVELAEGLGLEVCYSDAGEAILMGSTIFVPRRVRISRLHWLIAHELGHWALRDAGEDDTCERAANYVGGALLLPRAVLNQQLRSGWDLERLRRSHPHAPASAIAARVVQLREEAGAAVYDQGRLRHRWGRAFRDEPRMAAEALATGAPVRLDDLTGAWPVFDGTYRRVIVLGEAG